MLRIAFAAFVASAACVSAQQVREFNGYSVLISAHPADSEKADDLAQRVCASTGKSAERQFREKGPLGRDLIFYICV